MANLNMNLGDVDAFHKNMHAKHDELVSMINKVQGQEQSTTATWKGTATQAFKNFMEQYYDIARKMNTQLRDTADNIGTAGKQQAGSDEDFASAVGQQTNSLNMH